MNIALIGKYSYINTIFMKRTNFRNVSSFTLLSSRDQEYLKYEYFHTELVIVSVGIAHVSATPAMEKKYYEVNRDLPILIAKKAKKENVRHIIFLSSMIVYGDDYAIDKPFVISQNTKPNPVNFYGKSKLEAEEALLNMADENFKVTILRLPMVYGPGCKGNFVRLIKIAEKTPLFPSIENKRSMIFIDNLCAYLDYVIANKITGIVFPQNMEYVSTLQIIKIIASLRNRKIWFTPIFNPIIRLLSKKMKLLCRIWGTKYYDSSLSPDVEKYNVVPFEESIKLSIEGTMA